MNKKTKNIIIGIIALIAIVFGVNTGNLDTNSILQSLVAQTGFTDSTTTTNSDEILGYLKNEEDALYEVINDNKPIFEDYTVTNSFEIYSDLDSLGRVQVAYANISKDIMPTEDRTSISHVKPSGWQTYYYDHVDGKYLYNRSHLIGFQLAGENDNEKNLMTGTRTFNVEGMLPFENMVADYVKETSNHVLYRITPIYEGDNLVATGVQMEAYSVEDKGEGVSFNVFVYNKEPGVTINYETGESELSK